MAQAVETQTRTEFDVLIDEYCESPDDRHQLLLLAADWLLDRGREGDGPLAAALRWHAARGYAPQDIFGTPAMSEVPETWAWHNGTAHFGYEVSERSVPPEELFRLRWWPLGRRRDRTARRACEALWRAAIESGVLEGE